MDIYDWKFNWLFNDCVYLFGFRSYMMDATIIGYILAGCVVVASFVLMGISKYMEWRKNKDDN